jgi:predicted AAA+ superfamily ATPase
VYRSPLLDQFPKIPGVYTLGGGRQIGKSTLLKQWMLELIESGVNPKSLVFISGEMISDHYALYRILGDVLKAMPSKGLNYIFVDEVTYIKEWDKAIKYAADAGLFEQSVLMLTGSDLTLIQEARMRFPGRRGKSDVINFHLFPLSFKESVLLKHPTLDVSVPDSMDVLFENFNHYLCHGGFLTAINEFSVNKTISIATLTTYSEWIRGDMLKRGKQEHFLREIITSIIKRYGTQVSWNALSKDLSIDHPQTVADYAAHLENMDTLFIQGALLEDKLTMAPKKAKKLFFADPFIFHALRSWIWPAQDPFKTQIQPILVDPERCSGLVEACVVTHFRRFYPTYYIKAEGEVDIAYVDKNSFWPIEIKWTTQLRSKDLKQILKYPQGRIWAKTKTKSKMQGIPVEPLPLALFLIEEAIKI